MPAARPCDFPDGELNEADGAADASQPSESGTHLNAYLGLFVSREGICQTTLL